jgi:hypothetical protein
VGTSSAQIERQITETRQHIDANLSVLERRAASGARRVGRIAIMTGAGLAAAAVAGIAIYMLTRRRTPAVIVKDAVPGSIRDLPKSVAKVLRRRLPTVRVTVADADDSRGSSPWRTMVQKVAITVVVSTAGALASRILKPRRGPSHS